MNFETAASISEAIQLLFDLTDSDKSA